MSLLEFKTPAVILLRRAQLTLILAALVPTVLLTALGILLLFLEAGSATVVAGILVLAFCSSALTGYILGTIFLSRGASLAMVQNDFLSSVSHELRTPLTSIRLYLDTVRQDRVTDPRERSKCLAIIDQELGRLDSLVGRLLQLSRIESGRQVFEEKPVRVEDVVSGGLAALEAVRLGNLADGTVEVSIEPDLVVIGDATALGQAISNLLVNAWKHGAETHRRIDVRARRTLRGQVEIVVSDNGPGLSLADQRRIFDAFEQGRKASKGEGVGLGLAIVRAIVRAHHGRVDVLSAHGQGAEFRILLPYRKPGVLRP